MNFNAKTFIAYTTSILVVCGIIVYIYIQSSTYLKGPQLKLLEPIDGTSTSSEIAIIRGVAKNISFITLDDNPIFANEDGEFSEKLILDPGYNIIRVKATDRFNRNIIDDIHITYKQSTTTENNFKKIINTGTSTVPSLITKPAQGTTTTLQTN